MITPRFMALADDVLHGRTRLQYLTPDEQRWVLSLLEMTFYEMAKNVIAAGSLEYRRARLEAINPDFREFVEKKVLYLWKIRNNIHPSKQKGSA